MPSRDEDFEPDLALTESDDGFWSPSGPAPAREPRDWQSRCEQQHARATAAEARVQELLNDIRRLRGALRKAESGKSTPKTKLTPTPTPIPKRVPEDGGRLEKALKQSQALKGTIKSLRTEMDGLRTDNRRLRKEVREAENRKGTIKSLSKRIELLHELLGTYRNQKDDVRVLSRQVDILSEDVGFLRPALKTSEKQRKVLASRVRVIEPRLATNDAQLRAVLRRSRAHKTTIKTLSRERARLRKAVDASQARIARLEAQLGRLRASRAVLSKALFGSRSEQQEKPGTGRKRGQQPGVPGHGRTPRPGLEERTEEHNPPADACVCGRCGQPYVQNGVEESTLLEIEVRAHKRVISRPRWRRTCKCASSPMEVSAPPVPRLFPRTPYGTSVWGRVLFERYASLRPLHRVSAWLSDHGLPISPGTLADSVDRFAPLFEPVADAILAHQNQQAVRHGDETGWRIQSLREIGRSSRAWLWNSVSEDAAYFRSDPSRSAEVAKTLFGKTVGIVFVVCDRYSAYKKMARDLDGMVILCFCWVHQRRDFIECAAGHNRLTDWCQSWIERIASIYSLNKARLRHYDPALVCQTPEFDAAQGDLEKAVDKLFADAEAELAGLPTGSREVKPLRSLLNHREGLGVFVHNPQVPMDNNASERAFRKAVIGRRLSFGSDSEHGAKFTAIMYSVVGTLAMNGIDVRRWLEAWLNACAQNGGKSPDDLSPWLPWSMSEERRRTFTAPG